MKPIYLDNNATTCVDPRVREALVQELNASIGNPSSIHQFGREVRTRLTKARRKIADYLGVQPQEILFTSSGTEAINTALFGMAPRLNHIITSNVEHAAVYSALHKLNQLGAEITYLDAGMWGAVSPRAVEAAIRPETGLIAVMAVNNETGVKTDIEAISRIAEKRNIPLFLDGVCWLGKEQISLPKGVTAAAFSGHKLHAPSGTGLLYCKTGTTLTPLLWGGGQEYNKRGGTENLLGIAGLAKAVELLENELNGAQTRMAALRDHLEQSLMDRLEKVVRNGEGPRICNTANLSFPGLDGESLLMNLDLAGIAVSHGSACSSGALEPSRVLLEMGIPKERANTAIRFSLSRFTTREEIDASIEAVAKIVRQLRSITAVELR